MLTVSDDPEFHTPPRNDISPSNLKPNSDEWVTAYYAAIEQCKLRYKQLVYNKVGVLNGRGELLKFLDEFSSDVPLPKLCRWLGYVQGTLIEKNLTTVDEERDWTRPLFRPLDFPVLGDPF